MACFKKLSWHSLDKTVENHDKPQSGQPVTRRYKPYISHIHTSTLLLHQPALVMTTNLCNRTFKHSYVVRVSCF